MCARAGAPFCTRRTETRKHRNKVATTTIDEAWLSFNRSSILHRRTTRIRILPPYQWYSKAIQSLKRRLQRGSKNTWWSTCRMRRISMWTSVIFCFHLQSSPSTAKDSTAVLWMWIPTRTVVSLIKIKRVTKFKKRLCQCKNTTILHRKTKFKISWATLCLPNASAPPTSLNHHKKED